LVRVYKRAECVMEEALRYKEDWQAAQRGRQTSGSGADSFVYVHLRGDDGEPFYVGIGSRSARPWEMSHSRTAKHKNCRKKHGVDVQIVADNLTWDQACFWEIRWIAALRNAGYPMTNLTDGGDGVKGLVLSQKARETLSIKNTARLLALGENHPSKRPEVREKISKSHTGKTMPVGENSVHSKLTESQVIDVLESTNSIIFMARKHNINPATIKNIRDGDIWGHLKEKVNKPEKYDDDRFKLSDEQVLEILESTESNKKIGNRLGVMVRTISAIRCGRMRNDLRKSAKIPEKYDNDHIRLTEEQVSEIKISRETNKSLGKKFGVHYDHIRNIRRGVRRSSTKIGGA